MRIFIATALTACGLSWGASLNTMKNDIDYDLRRLEDEKKAISKRCTELEVQIPEFNKLNDAQNKALADKRAEKKSSDDQIADAQKVAADSRAQYNATLGTINAKIGTLAALRGAYLTDLKKQRASKAEELKTAVNNKRSLERLLGDLDNFKSKAEQDAAEAKFYELKDKIEKLTGEIAALDSQIRNPAKPEVKALQEEIAALEAQAKTQYTAVTEKMKALVLMLSANAKLGAAIAEMEKKLGAFKNFVLPAICNTL